MDGQRKMQKRQGAAAEGRRSGKTRWRGVREVYGQKEKVTQTRTLAHTRKHTHTQSTLAALNVACRRKF